MNFPQSRLYNVTEADPSLLLVDAHGKPLQISGRGVYDMRIPKMRQAFVANAMHGMQSGVIDGVFIDRANYGQSSPPGWPNMILAQRQLLGQLTARLGEGNITLAKEHAGTSFTDWQVANAAMTSDAFCSKYCHQCKPSVTPASTWDPQTDAQDCANSIATIAKMSARGQLTQSHAMGPFDDSEMADESRAFVMAAFLIGAGDLSYFSYANWASDSWTMAGTKWWPEYDKKLGRPITPANTKVKGQKWKYHRRFSSGTTVVVDLETRDVTNNWGK